MMGGIVSGIGSEQSYVERRREERHEKRWTVDVSGGGDRNGPAAKGRRMILQNVSEGGFCFEVEGSLQPGEMIRFCMDLPDAMSVQGEARVCWVIPQSLESASVCGAQIRSIGWLDASRLRKNIKPYALDWGDFFDLGLKAVCCIVAVLVAQNLLRADPWLSGRAAALGSGATFDVLARFSVVIAAAVGILFYFFRKL